MGERQEISLPEEIDALKRCQRPALQKTAEERLAGYIHDLREGIEGLFPSDSLRHALNMSPDAEPYLNMLLATFDLDLFWTSVERTFQNERQDELYELRLRIFLLGLTRFRLPLFERLQELRRAEGLNTLRSISNLAPERWRRLLASAGVDLDPRAFLQDVDRAFDQLIFGGCAWPP